MHQIGAGALGPVFRTYDPGRDRLVAVKVFRLDITPEQSRTLADELSRMAEIGLSHLSIVTPLAAGVEGTVAYLASEYVAAESLDVALRHYAPAPVGTVLPYVAQLAAAVDAAAGAGVYHGTLHPRDVFVTPDQMRATGFGVAQALDRIGVRAPVRRPYSAPERIEGGPWDTSADVFSLAAIAFELLTGRRVAGAGSEAAGMLGEAAVGVDRTPLELALAAGLAVDPIRRYQTATEFAAALEAVANGKGFVQPAAKIVSVVAAPARAKARGGQSAEPPAGEGAGAGLGEGVAPDRDVVAEIEAGRTSAARVPGARIQEDQREVAASTPQPRYLFDEDAGEAELQVRVESVEMAEREGAPERVEAGAVDERGSGPPYAAVEVSGTEAAAAEVLAEPEPPALPEEEPRAQAGAAVLSAPVPAAAPERAWPRMLPYALVLVVGVLAGFVAGYGLGSRERAPSPEDIPGPAEGRPAPDSGRAWSEGAVTQTLPPGVSAAPPSAPPVVPEVATPAPTETLGTVPAAPPTAAIAPPAAGPSKPLAGAKPSTPTPVPARGAAPARPVQAQGRLLVRSTPAGADVTVDGQRRGETPLVLRGLPLGPHAVGVARDGYLPETRRVVISQARPAASLIVELRPTPPPAGTGSLLIDSQPRGARVFLDGRLIGTTPMLVPELKAGAHQVRVERDGFQQWTTTVDVVAGQRSRVAASLAGARP